MLSGEGASLPYRGLLADDKVAEGGAVQLAADSSSTVVEGTEGGDGAEGEGEDDSEDSEDEDGEREKWSDDDSKPRGKRFEDKGEKKAHKEAVKEEKRERRKEKMPKHVKKKLVSGGDLFASFELDAQPAIVLNNVAHDIASPRAACGASQPYLGTRAAPEGRQG
ncbi:Serine/threonine-protein kinase rio1 [Elasticomyces elasticus]|nr:Serine/threonine-protein kinase rio1 [Elasticomyces elasticus]